MKSQEHVARNLGEAWKWGGCNPSFVEVASCVEVAMKDATASALEEAAKVAEGLERDRWECEGNPMIPKFTPYIAAAIRALKEAPCQP
jgi:hypothetical protein